MSTLEKRPLLSVRLRSAFGDTTREIWFAIRKKRREIRAILFMVIVAGWFCSFFFFLDRWTDSPGSLMPTVAYFGVLLVAVLLLFMTNRLTSSEYEIAERRFEARSKRPIINAFGQNRYLKLQSGDNTFILLHAIELCTEMLNSPQAGADMDLRFYVLVRLAGFYGRDGQHEATVNTLQSALAIRPYDAIVNSRLAERLEMVGKGNEAISRYEAAQRDVAISAKLKTYFSDQIERVRNEGPRVSGPFDGSGLWWMWGS